MAVNLEPLQPPLIARVQYVGEVPEHRDARREVASGWDDVHEPETFTADAEDGQRIAAGIDGEEQRMSGVVDERALRRQQVRFRPGRRGTASAARGVGGLTVQAAVALPFEDDDLVAGELVGLDEHELLALAVAVAVSVARVGRLGRTRALPRSSRSGQAGW
jgi:hypothetical protein